MHIVLNDYPMKNVEDPMEIISIIFSSISDLNYWSCEALEELYIGVFAMVARYCKEKAKTCFGTKKTKYARFANKDRNRFLPKSRGKMLSLIYEQILSSENLGRCHGFGFSNKSGDNMRGNAEMTRLTLEKK